MIFATTRLARPQEAAAPASALRTANFAGFVTAVIPLMLLPLFAAAILLNISELAARAVLTALAPAFFYCGYAMYAVRRATVAMAHRQARFESEVRLRMDEFNPQEARLSRDYFELKLAQEIKRSQRHSLPLCVVTLRLLPKPNGERLFTSDVVRITAGTLRAEDNFGRLSINQYVISLPHTTPAGAGAVIERLTAQLAGHDPQFGLAFLPPGRFAPAGRLIEIARATSSRPEAFAA